MDCQNIDPLAPEWWCIKLILCLLTQASNVGMGSSAPALSLWLRKGEERPVVLVPCTPPGDAEETAGTQPLTSSALAVAPM